MKEKACIQFAHANGFPSRTYNQLFKYLGDEYEIRFLDRHGHDPEFPVSENWLHLKDELIVSIEKGATGPLIGVGHSFGGILHLMAAAERPDLYKSIVLLDAMIISPLSSLGLKILKRTRLMDRVSPSYLARRRRTVWPTREAAFNHFSGKDKFQNFHPDALTDFVFHGLLEENGSLKLHFDAGVEAKIYATVPDHLPRLKEKLTTPIAYIGGTLSTEARLARISFMKKEFPFKYLAIEGSHLFPFELPRDTAQAIKFAISEVA